MKLKFLTLFMVLGLFAMGTPVKAVEEKAGIPAEVGEKRGEVGAPEITPGSVIQTLICTAINALNSTLGKLPSCCTTICSSSTVDPTAVGKCIYSLAQVGKTSYCVSNPTNQICTATAKAVSTIKSTCLSRLNPCGTISCGLSSTVKQACGYVCCNVDAGSGVNNCIGGSCTPYTTETSCLNPAMESAMEHLTEPF